MTKQSLFLAGFFLFLLSGFVYSQTFDADNFQPLRCSGEIPEAFLQLSSAKYRKDRARRISEQDSRTDREAKDKFLLQSNFLVDEMLISGKVLFNDPVTDYVNDVADILLKDNPKLRGELQFYAVKSTECNAFATNQGIVFVNVGLIGRLETEAQLAFILSHEIQHYVRQHPLNKYVEVQRIERGEGVTGNLSFDERVLARNTFSREQESEADADGFRLFQKSGYNLVASLQVMDVLNRANLPVEEIPFEPELLETEHLVFPGHYHLEKINPIEYDEDYKDSLTTHPNIAKRKLALASRLSDATERGVEDFLLGEKRFSDIQNLCRFEMAHLYLQSHRFEQAIFHSNVLLETFPDNKYLEKVVGESLYGISEYANSLQFYDIHAKPRLVMGEFHQVAFLFDKLSREEMTVLALNYNWRLHKQYPKDLELQKITQDLLDSFFSNYADLLDEMSRVPRDSADVESMWKLAQDRGEDDSDEDIGTSKVDQVALYMMKEKEEKEESLYFRFGFVKMFKDQEFNTELEKRKAEAGNQENREVWFQEAKGSWADKKLKGQKLGLDRVVFVKPFFQEVDQRKETPVRYVAAESGLLTMNQMLRKNAERLDLDIDILDMKEFGAEDTEKFNDMVVLNNWFMEQMQGDNVNMVAHNSEAVIKLADKYQTDHFAWTGFLAVTDSKSFEQKMGACLLGYATCVLMPWAIAYYFQPNYETYQFTLLFNVREGTVEMADLGLLKYKKSNTYLNSLIYYSLLQMSSK